MLSYLFPLAVICTLAIQKGQCIDCHQCASKDDGSEPPFCTDPYDAEEMGALDGCDDKDTHCLKSKVTSRLNDAGFITGQARESIVVTRGCIRADGEGDYCKYVEADSAAILWCLCSSDGCNSGHGVVASMTFILVTVAMATLFLRL